MTRSLNGGMRRAICALVCATGLISCESLTETKAGLGSLREVNRYSQPISEVYFRPCGDDAWGKNRLPSVTIDVGAAAQWDMLPGCWDIKAVAMDSRTWLNPDEIVVAGNRLELTAK
jgi:hypothetical protein